MRQFAKSAAQSDIKSYAHIPAYSRASEAHTGAASRSPTRNGAIFRVRAPLAQSACASGLHRLACFGLRPRLRQARYRNGIGFGQDLEASLAGPFRHLDDLGDDDGDIILAAAIQG